MNLENLVSVSGMPGIYRIAGNRNNGLIVEDLATGKKKFVSSRRHQFTPLESIAVFTDDGESTELKNVFRNMKQQLEENPPVDPNQGADELHEYFAEVLPNYDKDRVFTGDIKKIIKWFNFLNDHHKLSEETPDNSEEE
jgi:hypothetical protein